MTASVRAAGAVPQPEPLHVVVVARGWPRPGSPTHGIFEWDQARALADAGHRVSFASLDVRSVRRRRRFGVQHLERDGIQVLDLNWPLGNVPPRVQDAVLARGWARALADITDHLGRPDIVHAHFAPWGLAASTAAHDQPVVVTEHWTKLTGDVVDPALARQAARAYAGADAVVSVSDAQAAVLRARFGIEPVVVPNVVHVDTFAPAITRRVAGHHRVVTVSGLRPIKRQHELVRAVAQLDGVRLDVVGEGPDRPMLESLAERLGVGGRVRFWGHLGRADIATRFADADVFALASEYETFGVVHVEAMAAGLPVVTTRSGAPEALVTPGTGIVVPDVGAPLVDGLRRALAADWDRPAIAESVQRFAPASVAGELTELYRRLLRA